jgi:hypothetical protein
VRWREWRRRRCGRRPWWPHCERGSTHFVPSWRRQVTDCPFPSSLSLSHSTCPSRSECSLASTYTHPHLPMCGVMCCALLPTSFSAAQHTLSLWGTLPASCCLRLRAGGCPIGGGAQADSVEPSQLTQLAHSLAILHPEQTRPSGERRKRWTS